MGKDPNKVKAFVIGVVSRCELLERLFATGLKILLLLNFRGKGCARKDSPGIYTRVKKYLDWIYKIAGEDKCTS